VTPRASAPSARISIDFDFFEDEPPTQEASRTERVVPRRGPQRPPRGPTNLTPLLRLIGLIAFAILIVVLVTSIVLFLTFGSVFLPIKAVLMSMISVTASFGALVWIFQDGNLSELLGFETSHTIGAWEPIIMFAILFGLSMDYEVLLLSRIRERYLATGNNTRAVAEGIGITGGTSTPEVDLEEVRDRIYALTA